MFLSWAPVSPIPWRRESTKSPEQIYRMWKEAMVFSSAFEYQQKYLFSTLNSCRVILTFNLPSTQLQSILASKSWTPSASGILLVVILKGQEKSPLLRGPLNKEDKRPIYYEGQTKRSREVKQETQQNCEPQKSGKKKTEILSVQVWYLMIHI